MPAAQSDAAPARHPGALRQPTVLVALLAAALGGGLVGRQFAGPRASIGAEAAPSPVVEVPRAAQPSRSVRALRAATAAPVGDDLGSESTRALRDPAYLRELMARYAGETDPDRRGALLAVLQSTQWDRQADMEPVLYEAMLDPEPQVQQAAIAGVNATLAHSPRLKDALLEMAGNDAIERDQRTAAVFALQHFPLDRDEYELYRRVAMETGPAASEAVHGPGHGR